MSEAEIADDRPLEPEDEARADFYALARAACSPTAPDAPLLAAIARRAAAGAAPTAMPTAAALAAAWDALRAASAAVDPDGCARRIPDAFRRRREERGEPLRFALSRAPVGAPAGGDPRGARDSGARPPRRSSEFEDHLSVVLETMRMLVAGDAERRPAPIAEQRAFFDRHVMPWALDCCTAISRIPLPTTTASSIIRSLFPGART